MMKKRSLTDLGSSARLRALLLFFGAVAAVVLAPISRAQFNDDFANAAVISGGSGTDFGSNVGATSQTNEPSHGGPGGASVWYAWTAPDNGTVIFDTFGSSFDTLLAAYTGNDFTNLVQIAANDDSADTYQSRISFSAVLGKTYFIAVDGYNGRSGFYRLTWSLPPV